MVLAVGSKALKVVEFFVGLEKEYIADLRLGAVSTTYDAEGVIEEIPLKAGWVIPEDSSRIQTLITDHFIGKISQVPPIYSAIHVGGERAYRKAMRGENVEMKARETTIHSCAVTSYSFPHVSLCVHCDSGTYIRSLANDLGQTMRCGAYLTALKRTKVGEWSIDSAKAMKDVQWTDVIPLKDILKGFPGVVITHAEWEELRHGRSIDGTCPSDTPFFAWHHDLPVAVLEANLRASGTLKPRKVL